MTHPEYTTAELDAFDCIFDNAAWGIENEDQYFAFVQLMDPDGSIESALGDRHYEADQARRAALSESDLAAEDAHRQQMVDRGMVIVRRIMAEKRESHQ